MTSLTLYGLSAAATTLPQASQLTATGGGSSTTTTTTLIGQSTGYGEVAAQGTTAAWGGYNGPLEPTGLGLLFDVTTLELQQINAGTWTPTFRLNTSAGSIVADLLCRFFLVTANGSYVPFTQPSTPYTMVLAAQTINTSPATYALTGVNFPTPLKFLTGGKLYIDLWPNITTNSTGSNSATLALTLSSTTSGVTTCQIVTPGYSALTQSQLLTMYSYGNFCLNDGVIYTTTARDKSLPEFVQTEYEVARSALVKKTGERVNSKKMPVSIRVVGNGRADVVAKWEALLQALYMRQQKLLLSEIDSRYYVADALKLPVNTAPGKINSMEGQITFAAQNPYPYSQVQRTFSMASQTFSLVTGQLYQSTVQTFTGGGQVAAYPVITITNTAPEVFVTLTSQITNGTTGITSISVTSTQSALSAGDSLGIGTMQQQGFTVSANTPQGSTSIPTNSWSALNTYPVGTPVIRGNGLITQVTLKQTTDNITMTIPLLYLWAGGSLIITCDPTVANGETVYGGAPISATLGSFTYTGSIGPIYYQGTFPVTEPGGASWQIQAMAAGGASTPQMSATWAWYPRFATS